MQFSQKFKEIKLRTKIKLLRDKKSKLKYKMLTSFKLLNYKRLNINIIMNVVCEELGFE